MGVTVMDKERREWVRLRLSGLAYKAIGEIVGRHPSTIQWHLRNVPVSRVVTHTERRRIRVLRRKGKTFPEIASLVGRSEYTCWQYGHDVSRRSKSKRILQMSRTAERIEALFAACNRAIAEHRL
jgi:IS30 family transposase